MDRREAIERLQALIRDVRKSGTSSAALSRLEDALDKLLQEAHEPKCLPPEDAQWEVLDGLLDRAKNGGPCWYIDDKLVIESGESAPYAMHYGDDGLFFGTFEVAHFYAKTLRVFSQPEAARVTLRMLGVKEVQ